MGADPFLVAEKRERNLFLQVKLASKFLFATHACASHFYFSYAGLIYDLIISPMLCFKATFPLAVIMTLFFHSVNKIIMNIGIFPWVMITSTYLFFHDCKLNAPLGTYLVLSSRSVYKVVCA